MRYIGIAAIAVGVLSGCGGTERVIVIEQPAQTVAPRQTSAPLPVTSPAVSRMSAEDQAFADAEMLFGEPIAATEYEVINAMYEVCDNLDRGTTLEEIAQAGSVASGGDQYVVDFLSAVIVAGVMNLCPEHSYLFEK